MLLLGRKQSRRTFEKEALPHLDALYGVGLRLTRNERDAEDLVQDTILRAWRFFDHFEVGTNCKAWLFKILHNTFVNKYRRRVREREVASAIAAEGGVGPVLSHEQLEASRDPERAILESVLSDDVRRALDALPEDFRLAVVLCDLEELSYKEIAEVMDCPVGTVMSRLYRGRRLLQGELRRYAAEQGIGVDQAASTGDSGDHADVIPLRRGSTSGGGPGAGGAS